MMELLLPITAGITLLITALIVVYVIRTVLRMRKFNRIIAEGICSNLAFTREFLTEMNEDRKKREVEE